MLKAWPIHIKRLDHTGQLSSHICTYSICTVYNLLSPSELTIITLTMVQECMLHGILMLIFGSDLCWKSCLAGIETWVQSPTCRMDTRKTPAAKTENAAAPCRVPRDICVLAILKNFPYPSRNCFSTYWHMLPIFTQKQRIPKTNLTSS